MADKFKGRGKKLVELAHWNEEKENYCNNRTGKFLNRSNKFYLIFSDFR